MILNCDGCGRECEPYSRSRRSNGKELCINCVASIGRTQKTTYYYPPDTSLYPGDEPYDEDFDAR